MSWFEFLCSSNPFPLVFENWIIGSCFDTNRCLLQWNFQENTETVTTCYSIQITRIGIGIGIEHEKWEWKTKAPLKRWLDENSHYSTNNWHNSTQNANRVKHDACMAFRFTLLLFSLITQKCGNVYVYLCVCVCARVRYKIT